MIDFVVNNVNILADCGLFNGPMYAVLSDIYIAILYAIPCLVFALCLVDIVKAVTAQDEQIMKKAQMTCIKRIIIGVVIFFVPILLNIILGYVTDYPLGDTCGIEEEVSK